MGSGIRGTRHEAEPLCYGDEASDVLVREVDAQVEIVRHARHALQDHGDAATDDEVDPLGAERFEDRAREVRRAHAPAGSKSTRE